MKEITTIQELNQTIKNETTVLAYFSHKACNVCHVMKPKLSAALSERYPQVKQIYIDIQKTPEIAGQNSIFTAPVALLFIEGRENLRKSQNFGINELMDYIERPYKSLITP